MAGVEVKANSFSGDSFYCITNRKGLLVNKWANSNQSLIFVALNK